MKELSKLKKNIQRMRKRSDNIISVANNEWYSLFKEEIRNSIAIEGVFADRNELIDVLEHNKRTDKQKAAAILGYFDAATTMYEYAYNQWKENEFTLRMADIKQIHTLLMRYEKDMGIYIGERGEFRRTTAEVTQSNFTPISHYYIRPAMELLIRWINKKLKARGADEVFLSAAIHTWFETIHPFRDGNGRAGRILMNYILIGQGLINIAIKGIAKKDRDNYYDALEIADDGFEDISRMFEKGESVRLIEVDEIISNGSFSKLEAIVLGLLDKSFSRIESAREIPSDPQAVVPLKDLALLYGFSKDYLRNLINRGRLKGHKRGKLWYVRVRDMADYAGNVSSKQKD